MSYFREKVIGEDLFGEGHEREYRIDADIDCVCVSIRTEGQVEGMVMFRASDGGKLLSALERAIKYVEAYVEAQKGENGQEI